MRKGVVGVRRGEEDKGRVVLGRGRRRAVRVGAWFGPCRRGDAPGKRLKHFDVAWPRGAFLGSTVRAGAPAVLRGRDLLDARGMGVLDWIFRKFACRL